MRPYYMGLSPPDHALPKYTTNFGRDLFYQNFRNFISVNVYTLKNHDKSFTNHNMSITSKPNTSLVVVKLSIQLLNNLLKLSIF